MIYVFTDQDLGELSLYVIDCWSTGLSRDWSAPAGTLTWSCARTADHAVDTVFAPALWLASGKEDGYPDYGSMTCGEDAPPERLLEALATATRLLLAVVRTAPPQARATIWRRPRLEVRGPRDFPPRAGLELALHGHDVCRGLGLHYSPPAGICERLRQHTADWPMWTAQGWQALTLDGDPFDDLLRASGRESQPLR